MIYFLKFINKMKRTKNLTAGVILLLLVLSISSCDKKEDPQTQLQQQEQFANKDKELKDKEDFLKIKEEQLRQWEERLKQIDSTLVSSGSLSGTTQQDTSKTKTTSNDSVKVKEKSLKEKKMEEKEKELNKRLDNPKVAVNDYLEYIQRGVNDSKTFESNMKKASEVWENRSTESFKKNYKSTKKFIVAEEPKVVSQKGGNAVVKVKVKQTMVGADGKEVEKTNEISYILIADKSGKWKIKSNVVK